jgi:hypothetical protein
MNGIRKEPIKVGLWREIDSKRKKGRPKRK